MNQKIFKIKIAGQAGQGIKSAGLILSKFLTRQNHFIYNYIEYPSLIRGGHNVIHINFSSQKVYGPSNQTDFLLALNSEAIMKHRNSLTNNSVVIFDSNIKFNQDLIPNNSFFLKAPLNQLAKEAGGGELLINVVSLGILCFLLDGDLEVFNNLLKDEYGSNPKILESDYKAIKLGYDYAEQNFVSERGKIYSLNSNKSESNFKNMVMDGDEAVTLAAIASGLSFASIYPMTPITNILHNLAKYQNDFQYIYVQPEDEISAINMAIGASHAGVRSMTATSGGGFCLMSEGYGLAGITETPLVIIEGMRGGPATGLPTWNSQGDLLFVLNAHQDEFPRIVLSAGDLTEAFYLTMEAFYLADKYQTPVVLLVDKNICEHQESIPKFDTSAYKIDRGKVFKQTDPNYNRYQITEDGISPRTIPGMGNFFLANSDEHDEKGYSSETSENRISQMRKRMQKMVTCEKNDLPNPQIFGSQSADLSIISWGSNKSTILEILKEFPMVNFLHLTWMNPFPKEFVKNFIKNSKRTVLVESNYSGQLGKLISMHTNLEIGDKILKFDGRPFFVEELRNEILNRLEGKAL